MEGTTSRTDVKRAICRAFTNVITRTNLSDNIDPKAFLMMLNTQFPVLYRGGKLYLAPLWDIIKGGTDLPPDALVALFLRFNDAAVELAVPTELPPAVAALSLERQRAALATTFGDQSAALHDPSGYTPLVEVETLTPSEGLAAIPLDSADLRPVVDDSLKRKIGIALGQAVRTTPIGTKIESAQIAYLFDQNVDVFFNGLDFDFSQLVPPLKQVPEVTDLEITVFAMRLLELLSAANVGMKLPDLKVDMNEANAVLAASAAARRSPSVVELRGPSGPRGPLATSAAPGAAAAEGAPAEASPPPAAEKKRGRLAKWGFRLRTDASSKLEQRIRLGVALAIIVAVAAFGFLTRPNRPLDISSYDAVFPMKSAELVSGVFRGHLDDVRWRKLTYRQREQSVHALEGLLKNDGFIANLQIFDEKQRLVIFGAGPQLKTSEALLRDGLPPGDTTVPPEKKRVDPKTAAKSELNAGTSSSR